MSAIITPSGDYELNLPAANTFTVTGDLNVMGNIFAGNTTFAPNSISYGTSNVAIAAPNSNVTIAAGNAAGNVATFTNTGVIIQGDLTVSGNATLSGNISGDHIENGTTSIDIQVSGGNANITVGGVSNVAVFANTGFYVTGVSSTSGNVIGGNLVTGGLISATANVIAAANVIGGNLVTGGLISATANVIGGNVITGGVVTATANVIGGNLVTGGLIIATGNVTGGNVNTAGAVSATSNVTGGNIVTAGVVTATANIAGGNVLTAGQVSATGNITGGNVNTAVLRNDSGAVTISTGSGAINLNPAGNVVLGNTYINNLSQPVQDNDAASKIYVDNAVSTQLSYHEQVTAATTGTLETATGGTITYAQPNGAGNGVGATLTTTGSFDLIDTANVQTLNTRVLIKNQANAVLNGVYVWSNATVLTRATDADTYGAASSTDLSINDYFFVASGNVNKGSAYVVSAPTGTITFGTSNIAFSQFSSSQTYSGNSLAGILITGTTISAQVDNTTTAFDAGGNIIVKASANLTTPVIGAATGTSVSLTGNVTGGNILTVGLVTATGNIRGGNVITGGDITASSNIVAGGNVTSNYFIGNGSQLTGITVAGSTGGAIVSGTSNVRVALDANTTIGVAGNTVAEFANTGAYITGLLSATSNISAPYFIGNAAGLTGLSSNKIYNGTSEANIGASNGNANVTIGGVSNVAVFTTAGLNITGVTSTSGNVIGGNLVTGGQVSATANITGGNLLSAGLASVTGNISGGNLLTGALVSATSMVAAGNITGGNLLTGGLISSTGGITAAANITCGNLLTGGLISATGNITGGNVLGGANVNATTHTGTTVSVTANIDGGNLRTAGLITATGDITGGNLLTGGFISATGNSTVSGSLLVNSGGLRYNELDVLGNAGLYVGYATSAGNSLGAQLYLGDATLDTASFYNAAPGIGAVYNSSVGAAGDLAFYTFTGLNSRTEKVRINTNGNVGIACTTPTYKLEVVGTGYFSSGLTGGNLITGGVVTATGNVDAGNVNTGGLITATGNITGGNILTAGLITATGNVTGGNMLTGGLISATSSITAAANITGGNLLTGGLISATSSITAAANITGGNMLTGGLISATSSITAAANITGGNILTAGLISATANITGGNILTGGLISATANITGGNILTGGLISATSTITAAANITGGNILTGGLISATANITGGNLSVSTGTITGGNIINANGNGVGNIGSSSVYWNTVFAKATSAQYADLAEMYAADAYYEPGTVVSFGGTQEVTRTQVAADTAVAGVISSHPSYLMNSTLSCAHPAAVALTGRVPTRVTGPVSKGELMVSAGNGYAQACATPAVGTVIGKSLENFSGGQGMIEIVVGIR